MVSGLFDANTAQDGEIPTELGPDFPMLEWFDARYGGVAGDGATGAAAAICAAIAASCALCFSTTIDRFGDSLLAPVQQLTFQF